MGLSVIGVLTSLEAVSGRNDKKQILSGTQDPLFYEVLLAALDPYRTYGFQKTFEVPCRPEMTVEEEREGWMLFLCLLQDLAARIYTGNAAKEMVQGLFESFTADMQVWCWRVLLKNLRCGVEAKTVNDVISGLIPEFSVALAKELKIKPDGLADVTFPVWCDYKLDGTRTICVKEGRGVSFFTRKGHPMDTLPTLKGILEDAAAMDLPDFVLDAETMGRSWNDTQSTLFATKNKVDDSGLFLNVFDWVPLADWRVRKCEIDYMSRRQHALDAVNAVSHTQVRVVGGKEIMNPHALNAFFKEALAKGHEGIMVKDRNAGYSFGRSTALLKYKPHSTWEGRILGFDLGDPTGKRAGKFGSFMVQFKEGGPITNVGGGFSDEDIDRLTAELEKDPECYDGKIVEVKGQEMTTDGLVRFPVFVRFREEADT